VASAIGTIVILDREDALGVSLWLAGASEVRLAINEDGLRVKVDGGVWSPPLGVIQGSSR
jgi:hypothetical protein